MKQKLLISYGGNQGVRELYNQICRSMSRICENSSVSIARFLDSPSKSELTFLEAFYSTA